MSEVKLEVGAHVEWNESENGYRVDGSEVDKFARRTGGVLTGVVVRAAGESRGIAIDGYDFYRWDVTTDCLRRLSTPPAIDRTKAPNPLPETLPTGTRMNHGENGEFDAAEPLSLDGCVYRGRRKAGGSLQATNPTGIDWVSYYEILESNPREEPASEPAKAPVPKRADPYEAHRAALSKQLGLTLERDPKVLEEHAAYQTHCLNVKARAEALAALTPRARRLREQAAKQLDRKLPSEHPRGWPELAFVDAETCDP